MDSKILVAYFSASGETRKLAHTLAEVTGAELYEIEPETPYTSEDLNWNDKNSRSSVEMNDPSCRPAIKGRISGMDKYDTVFVGFPIWWYEAPRIIATFLESCDLSGKTVIPFATSGSSGMGKTDSILQKICPSANWKEGKRLSASASVSIVRDWVNELGVI